MFVSISATMVCVLMFILFPYLEDLAFAKGLLSLFFNLYFAMTNPMNMLVELCQDIHSELGDIDPVHTDTAMFLTSHKFPDKIVFICQLFNFLVCVIRMWRWSNTVTLPSSTRRLQAQ